MVLMSICPVDGTPMPAEWPNGVARKYCGAHCRSKGRMLIRWEKEREEMDEIVVLRLMQGDHIESTQAERMEAAFRLSRQVDTGMNAAGGYRMGRWGNVVSIKPGALMTMTEIGKRIGVTQSTAGRYVRLMSEPERMPTVTEALALAEEKVRRMHAPVLHRNTAIGWDLDRSA